MASDRRRYGSHLGDYFGSLPDELFEHASCFFCPADAASVALFEKWTMHIRRCICGLVWSARQPTERALRDFYTTSLAMEEWAALKEGPNEAARQREKFQGTVEYLAERKIKSCLDLGCGNGFFLSLLKEALPTCQVLGTDLSHQARGRAEARGIPTKAWGIKEALEDSEATWDAITLWGVLEHVKNPLKLLNLAHDRLNPGGYLVVCVPNAQSLAVMVLGSRCFTFCPQHLWYFDFTTLPRALHLCEFSILRTETIESERIPIAKAMRLLGDPYASAPDWAYNDGLIDLDEETILKEGFGYKIVAIAQKKTATEGMVA